MEEGRGTSAGEGRGVASQQRQQEHTAQHHNPQPGHMLKQFFNTKSCETFSLKHASRCEKLKWMTKQMFLQGKEPVKDMWHKILAAKKELQDVLQIIPINEEFTLICI
jgi:hypothetical protein